VAKSSSIYKSLNMCCIELGRNWNGKRAGRHYTLYRNDLATRDHKAEADHEPGTESVFQYQNKM